MRTHANPLRRAWLLTGEAGRERGREGLCKPAGQTDKQGRGDTGSGGALASGDKCYLHPDKPFSPGARFCHVLQAHLRSRRFPGAGGQDSVGEIVALQARGSKPRLLQPPPCPTPRSESTEARCWRPQSNCAQGQLVHTLNMSVTSSHRCTHISGINTLLLH